MKVVTGIFNSSNPKYGKLFKIFLYSLKKNTNVEVVVYHADLSSSYMQEIEKKVGGIEFIPIEFKLVEGIEKASQKVFLWQQIIELQKENDIVITDCDLLVVNDFKDVFNNDFEVGHTVKDFEDLFHVNGGLIFLKDIEKGKMFFREWCNMVKSILTNKAEAKKAMDLHGGADQAAIYYIFGKMKPYANTIVKDINMTALPSSIYNLHKRWEDFNDRTKIIHYKGDWISMLNSGDNYKKACSVNSGWRWENYESWEPVFNIGKKYESNYNGI